MGYRNRIVGTFGERVATLQLIGGGAVVLDRNWHCREGELDLVLRDADEVVFCEVKTRQSARFGPPAEAIVPDKAQRLRNLAVQWLATHRTGLHRVRFDVVGVVVRRGIARVEHLRQVF
jgi:putative endonuclease